MKLFPLFSQNDYEKLWNSVEKFESKGLPKSALDTVKIILEKAKKEQHTGQYLKALIHVVKFNAQVEEEGLINGITLFEKETEKAEFPAKPILQSILADFYWQYYQNNRHLFYNRTPVQGQKDNDIRTWDLQTLQNKITELYLASLQNKEKLKTVFVKDFPEIIHHYKENDIYAPTLFDFLTQRALSYFTNEERAITEPTYAFEVTDLSALSTPKTFIQTQFSTPDKESLRYQSLLLYQEMIAFHIQDKDPSAFIEWNLRRLSYAYRITFNENKDETYLQTLQQLSEEFAAHPEAAQIQYQIGMHLQTHGKTKNGLNPEQQAAAIYEKVIQKYPSTCRGVKNCAAALNALQQPEMIIQVEHQVAPNSPFKIYLAAKNLAQTYIRIVSLSTNPFSAKNPDEENVYETEKIIKFLLKQTPVQSFTLNIPFANQKDYQIHSTEVKIPALPLGRYAILVSADKNFALSKNCIKYAVFWVTNLSIVTQSISKARKAENLIRVLHAQTGKPIPQATVQVFYKDYNYQTRRYEFVKYKTLTTNSEGIAAMEGMENFYHAVSLFVIYQNDAYFSDKALYLAIGKGDKLARNQTFFFTDRVLYRPGQTIYFKALCLHQPANSEIYQIRQNESVTVYFYDVNHQLVSKLDLRTNEYGTVHGAFTAPMGVLNGNMYITDGNGERYFSVEEYKRPKFEVYTLPITSSYRLGDKITVVAEAKSYAGAAVTNAKVQYRVVRQARYPRWCWWWGEYPDLTKTKREIAHGITQTNEKGQAEITFEAIPDKSIDKQFNPIFTYTVYVDVTDLNGETRSTQVNIKAGYTAITLSTDIPDIIDRDKLEPIHIFTENLNGQHHNTLIKYAFVPLPKKEKLFRKRLWQTPTDFLLTKQEFYSTFPYDPYQNEHQYRLDEIKLPENAITVENKLNQTVSIPVHLPSGNYALIIEAQDKYGTPLRYEKEFVLYSPKETQAAQQEIFYCIPVYTQKIQPNEKAKILIGSALTDALVQVQVEHRESIVSQQLITLNQSQHLLEIPITEEMRGGIVVHVSMIHQYRFYYQKILISVPWDNKELTLKWSTFRNKLQPGQKEEWKLTVSGKNAEKVMAELLANLYDASLDLFKPNDWNLSLYPNYDSHYGIHEYGLGLSHIGTFQEHWYQYVYGYSLSDDQINYYGLYFYQTYRDLYLKRGSKKGKMSEPAYSITFNSPKRNGAPNETDVGSKLDDNEKIPVNGNNEVEKAPSKDKDQDLENKKQTELKIRTNFNETAFFYPQVQTNEKGEFVLSFTIPEALTKWKFMALAHTQDLKVGFLYDEVITQKELMVQPNAPRFFRETDIIEYPVKITNLSTKTLTGKVKIALFDALTLKPIESLCQISNVEQDFTIDPGQNKGISWRMVIPVGTSAITHRVVALTNEFSDGEEATAPVVTDRILVTESLPLPIRGKEKKKFTFDKLITQNAGSTTIRNHKLTLEFTSNPAWYAVQALPYLMEFPHECTEQIFSRFYANSIAAHIANSHPKIKAVFDRWANEPDSKALLSNLEKNQELKYALLEETPWVLEGKDETERKKRIALLFDLNRMNYELSKALKTLAERQTPNGGFAWFPGMPDNPWITQHILAGIGHLNVLGINVEKYGQLQTIIQKAVPYMDARMHEHYQNIKKYATNLNDNHLSYYAIHYLYTRSYFTEYKLDNHYEEAFKYFVKQVEKYWTSCNIMLKGMIALAMHRFAHNNTKAYLPQTNPKFALDIMKSIKEHAIYHEEMGMYFKENTGGYYWYQAPIETQALMIECFDEITNDQKSVEELKVWLLKHKQTNDWKTTKATVEACYALLRRGVNQLLSDELVEITLGSLTIVPEKAEAGTGYFKTVWQASDIKSDMGNITVHKKDEGVAWGAVYWQYFEQMDKVTPHETPLKLKKQIFIERNTDRGKVLEPITENTPIQVGDIVKVRIELRVDRDMEYIHLKDMRAAGFEPMNVLSQYKYQGGLGYYESTRDIATHFFMDYLRKGTYVFEYPLRAAHRGVFQNGIATIQCMYAPEFNSHSEGIKVEIK
ncbi:MAG: alpha-2-macroglobulin family protein [Bacteroidia bacterium]|nr:alpha-2-macroglobulin family protein [Bacteroidia bacterium]